MKQKLYILIILILTFVPSNWHVFAVDQTKTVETFIGDDTTSLTNTTVYKPFSIYVGDNLAGISNPIKSVYFVVTGVYTQFGAGTLDFRIDGDATTLKQFTMPNATAKPFELLYQDNVSKINPTSAGTYNYTLGITIPASITVYGLGVKVITTYRYAPVSCDDGQPTAQKIKTVHSFVGSTAGSVSASTPYAFSFYIGDDLSGITNPVKSVNFKITGVVSSVAAITVDLDSDAATSKVFTLPSGASQFEILYQDNVSKINPSSAGTYSYTLNVMPNGGGSVTGLAATMMITYRYKPPNCGVGMPVSGELTSNVYDTAVTDGAAYHSVNWKGQLGGAGQNEGKVRFQLATSNNAGGPWTYIGGATCGAGDYYDATNSSKAVETGCSGHNNARYYRYKVQICSNDCSTAGTNTPTVTDVNVSWAP